LVVRSFLDLKRQGLISERLVILGLKNLDSIGLEPRDVDLAHGWIHIPGFVPEAELPNYYRHASAFLFPSLYEGFGIPLLEAMASGTPIITSNLSSLPEVAGEAAILIDPSSTHELKEAILKLLGSPLLREQLRSAGLSRMALFQWPQTASQTLDCYQKVLSGQQPNALIPPMQC
jgi:glycosyltransferase involved in cell wall biosynthesis